MKPTLGQKVNRQRQRISTWLGRIHADEQGDVGLEKLLILAAVALPLLGFLLLFRDELWNWVENIWGDVKDAGQDSGGDSAL